jgi:hypothetical protein
MIRDEQRPLVASALVDDLTPDQAARLLEECRREPELLAELSHLTVTDRLLAHLHLYGDDEAFVREVGLRLRSVEPARDKILHPFPWWQPFWKLAAAAAVVALVGSLLLVPHWKNGPESNVMVVRTEAVSLTPGQPVLSIGQQLPAQRLQLDSGLLELRFKSGATVILEGPADFEVASALRCVLHRGTVVARVPEQARGFTVDGPRGRLVDLGTEFGVRVGNSGDTEVHVLKGRVEAFPTNQQNAIELTENQALRLTSLTNLALPADATAFVTDLPPGSKGPIGYVHWGFDEGQSNLVRETGQGLLNQPAPGHLLSFENQGPGPSWVPGQFGGGLSLNGRGDYVECEFAGIGGGRPRTVAFWVKVPKDFDLMQSDAIINWGTDARQGGVWRLSVNNAPETNSLWGGPIGRLRVGVHGGYVVGTTDLRDDRWHHCAVVMYGGQRPKMGSHVLIFIDGQLEPAARKKVFEISTDVQDATAHNIWIGRNLSYRTAGQEVPGGPFFRGCVDEVFVFNAALTQEQIVSLMKFNRLDDSAVSGLPSAAVVR